MTKGVLVLIIALSFTGVAIFCFWTARLANKKSEAILAAFKKTDSGLLKLSDSIKNKEEGTGTIKVDSAYVPELDLAFKVNKICICIDSIFDDLRPLIAQKDNNPFSYKNKARIKALKADILDYDAFIEKYFPGKSKISAADLVKVTPAINGSFLFPWDVYYFENTNVYRVSVLLTFIKKQVLKIERQVIQGS
jgi:hypothetical protein